MPPMGGPGGMGFARGRNFLTEEEKANRPKVTGAMLKRIFSYLDPYRGSSSCPWDVSFCPPASRCFRPS